MPKIKEYSVKIVGEKQLINSILKDAVEKGLIKSCKLFEEKQISLYA